jgi:hypothetical protein
MAITNTKIFGKHLDGDVARIFFDGYTQLESEFDKIAKVFQAPPGNHYREAELTNLGSLVDLPEGAGVQFDIPQEGHDKTLYYNQYGLGFQITRIMMKDDLQRNFEKMPAKLAKSAGYKRDTVFFDLLNSGFSGQTAWDSVAIFHTSSHTTLKSGTVISNCPSSGTSLSETSLQAAFEYYDTLVDEAGLPLDFTGPKKLVVPKELRFQAYRIMGTPQKTGSANNDLNAMAISNDYVDYTLHVSRFLTSNKAWFLLSPAHDLRFYWKEEAGMESADDFYTGNALFKVVMRFGVGCFDYKGGYGNPGA